MHIAPGVVPDYRETSASGFASGVLARPRAESSLRLDHLRALEAESIHIIREVVAEFERPVMLFSIGKDSSVLLRLAQRSQRRQMKKRLVTARPTSLCVLRGLRAIRS